MNLLSVLILLRFLFFLGIVTLFLSCNKTNKYGLGDGLNQNNPGIRLLKNIPINAVTIKSSPAATGLATYQMAGEYNDPYFGKHKAALMQGFGLYKDATSIFADVQIIDSIVWCLSYAGYYGDFSATNGIQTFKIYEITGGFSSTNTYLSNEDPFSYAPQSNFLGSVTLVPNPIDSVIINGVNRSPQLRLKLNRNLRNKLLIALKNNSTDISGELKGLMLYPDNPSQTSGQGAIFSFDLLNPDSKLSVYYRDAAGVKQEFDGLYSKAVEQKASLFMHDYSNAVFAPQLNGTASDTTHIYIQSMVSTLAKIDIPMINAFKDSGVIVVNKAEVIFKVDETISDLVKYKPHDKLILLPIDSLGNPLIIRDQSNVVITYDGYYNQETKEYKFNIGEYFQDVVNGKVKNYGMHLFAATPLINASRTILKTKENIIFNLTYTKF